MNFLGSFGNNELRSPYGITFYKQDEKSYKVLVTDSYEYNNRLFGGHLSNFYL